MLQTDARIPQLRGVSPSASPVLPSSSQKSCPHSHLFGERDTESRAESNLRLIAWLIIQSQDQNETDRNVFFSADFVELSVLC